MCWEWGPGDHERANLLQLLEGTKNSINYAHFIGKEDEVVFEEANLTFRVVRTDQRHIFTARYPLDIEARIIEKHGPDSPALDMIKELRDMEKKRGLIGAVRR